MAVLISNNLSFITRLTYRTFFCFKFTKFSRVLLTFHIGYYASKLRPHFLRKCSQLLKPGQTGPTYIRHYLYIFPCQIYRALFTLTQLKQVKDIDTVARSF